MAARGEGAETKPQNSYTASLVPRLDVALAVIAALRPPRRTVARSLGFVAGAGFIAAAALYQHAPPFAVLDHGALPHRLFRHHGILGIALAGHLSREIGARRGRDFLPQLLSQHAGFDFLDLAFLEFSELERAVGDAD